MAATNFLNFGPELDRVNVNIQLILTNQEKMMAAIDDLTKAVSDIQATDTTIKAAVATAVSLIQTLHSGGGGSVTDAQVEAVVAQLETASGDFSAAATSLGAAVPLP